MVVVTFEATADGSSKVNWLWQSASTIDEKNNLVYHIDNNGKIRRYSFTFNIL